MIHTKKQTAELERILRNAERALSFVANPNVLIGRVREGLPTTTLDYTCGARVFTSMNKEYGSDLAGLETAIGLLKNYLRDHGFRPR